MECVFYGESLFYYLPRCSSWASFADLSLFGLQVDSMISGSLALHGQTQSAATSYYSLSYLTTAWPPLHRLLSWLSPLSTPYCSSYSCYFACSYLSTTASVAFRVFYSSYRAPSSGLQRCLGDLYPGNSALCSHCFGCDSMVSSVHCLWWFGVSWCCFWPLPSSGTSSSFLSCLLVGSGCLLRRRMYGGRL